MIVPMAEPESKTETESDEAKAPDADAVGTETPPAEQRESGTETATASQESERPGPKGSTDETSSTAGLVKRTREALAREAEVQREVAESHDRRKAAGAASESAGRGSMARAEGWLAGVFGRLGEALSPSSIGQAAQASLLFWHWLLFDREFDKLLFRPTSQQAKISTLTVRGKRVEGRDYRPTPALVFEWAMSAIRDDLSHYRFVDYGAGRGRVLLMASQYPFKSIAGVEFAEELFEDARLNIAQFPRPRMRCRDVSCELIDATAIRPPEGTVVHYFFAPFSRKAFAEILNGIAASLRAHRRPAYIVLVDCRDGDLVRGTGLFVRGKMKLGAAIESCLFSPYRIEIYKAMDG